MYLVYIKKGKKERVREIERKRDRAIVSERERGRLREMKKGRINAKIQRLFEFNGNELSFFLLYVPLNML